MCNFPNNLKALSCGKVGMNDKGFKRLSLCFPPPFSSPLLSPAPFFLLQMNIHRIALNHQRESNKKIRKEILKFP